MRKLHVTVLFLGLVLIWATGGWGQTLTPPTPQFFFTGFIQEATLDTGFAICTPPNDPVTLAPSLRLAGGTITVNGIKMIVPCNSIIQFPAATFPWGDLFDPVLSAPINDPSGTTVIGTVPAAAVAPLTGLATQMGVALTDSLVGTGCALPPCVMPPFPSFAVNVNGNVVGKHGVPPYPSLAALGIPDGTDRYVVGLIVPVTQQDLNATSGLVSYIDYAIGAFRVGGILNDANCGALGITSPLCTGTLVQFNDPIGRWGLIHSPDPRFSGDFENTTIHVSNGFPLCIPRVAPPGIDPLCPLTNRPLNSDTRFAPDGSFVGAGGGPDPFLAATAPRKIFQMPAPVCAAGTGPGTAIPCANTVTPDAYQQVPMEVGDQVIVAGTLYKINPFATLVVTLADGTVATIPDNTPANTYISAHTVDDVMEVTTWPGVPPAYIFVEGMLIGTNGAAISGILQEASTRLTVVGFTTDPTRLVEIYAKDVNPCTGAESRRLLAITDPATQAFRTRFVHRVLGGLFMPPTRNYVMVSQTQFMDPLTGARVPTLVANGIVASEFSLPNFEYIFPENHRFGDPLIPNNYQDLPFLAHGEGPVDGSGTTSPIVGQLNPFPAAVAFTPASVNCAAAGASPVVTIVPSASSVATGGQVVLTGGVTWDPADNAASRTTTWAQVLGDPVTLVPDPLNPLKVSFTAPATPQVLTFTLTATDNFGVGSATATVTVLAASDIVQIPAGLATWAVQRGKRGGFGKLNVSATSSAAPAAILTLLETPNETATGGPVCPLDAPVAGGTCNWGTGSWNPATLTYDWVELKGAPQPASLTVISDHGGSATVTCDPTPTGTKQLVNCQ